MTEDREPLQSVRLASITSEEPSNRRWGLTVAYRKLYAVASIFRLRSRRTY